MHKLEFLDTFEADLFGAVDYIAGVLDNPAAAEELLDELNKTLDTVAAFPYAFELYRTDRPLRGEIRKAPVKNYKIYYAVDGDTVTIYRLIHNRRNRDNISLY